MPTLVRRLGLWSSVGIVVGITIGGGIFRTPASIADARARAGARCWRSGWSAASSSSAAPWRSRSSRPRCPRPAASTCTCARDGGGRTPSCTDGRSSCSFAPRRSAASRRCSASTVCGRSAWIPVAHARWADYLAAGAISSAAAANIGGIRIGALLAGLSTVAKFGALSLLVVASFLLGGGPRRQLAALRVDGRHRRNGALRPRAHLGPLGLRRVRGPHVRERRGQGPAEEPAAGHPDRHRRDHRDLSVRQHGVPVCAADRRHPVVAARRRRHDVDDVRAGRARRSSRSS